MVDGGLGVLDSGKLATSLLTLSDRMEPKVWSGDTRAPAEATRPLEGTESAVKPPGCTTPALRLAKLRLVLFVPDRALRHEEGQWRRAGRGRRRRHAGPRAGHGRVRALGWRCIHLRLAGPTPPLAEPALAICARSQTIKTEHKNNFTNVQVILFNLRAISQLGKKFSIFKIVSTGQKKTVFMIKKVKKKKNEGFLKH